MMDGIGSGDILSTSVLFIHAMRDFTSHLLIGQVVGDIGVRIVKLARKWQAGLLIPDSSSNVYCLNVVET